ncbi:MAG: ABC transporter permease [Planctomycetaceae bacterium]|jgi:hypothetical protein|nr:ABC transporter permease [Planctomycetaceae bacterium]
MIIEKPVPSLWEFLFVPSEYPISFGGLWIVVILALAFLTALAGLLFSILHAGSFGKGITGFGSNTVRTFADLFYLAPSRVWAIARLAVKESLRRRVLFLCVVFMLFLMFAGWFMNADRIDPAKQYLTFVLSMSTYLILLLAVFLSAFSLPNEIKSKTIFTIVTKPVRSSEIVLGRIIGFTIVGTAILVFMSLASYAFVSFSLQHEHVLTMEDLRPYEGSSPKILDSGATLLMVGSTRQKNNHRHGVEVYDDGTVLVEDVNNHAHDVTVISDILKSTGKISTDETGGLRFKVLPSREQLQARVPLYARSLVFRDTSGTDQAKGIDVGHEWQYRYYIGNFDKSSNDAGIFNFTGVTEKKFSDGLPVEMTLGVFRTYKGTIDKPVQASIAVRNPRNGLHAEVQIFHTEEYITKSLFIPRKISNVSADVVQRKSGGLETPSVIDPSLSTKRDFDLFEDFVADGEIELWIRCIDNQQFVGVSQFDVYLHEADASVFVNFFKGYYGIWQQMFLLLSFGVLFSTFLGGPVSMVAASGIMIAGFCKELMVQLAVRENLGGGPLESFMRMLKQSNLMEEMQKGMTASFVTSADYVSAFFLMMISRVIPPLSDYAYYKTALVAGFDIPANWIFVHSVTTFGYVLPIFFIAYIILSNREVAK